MNPLLTRFLDRLLGRNRCANCAHWLSADRQRGQCRRWAAIAVPLDAAIAVPLAAAEGLLPPGTIVPADASCPGFVLPDPRIGRHPPSGIAA